MRLFARYSLASRAHPDRPRLSYSAAKENSVPEVAPATTAEETHSDDAAVVAEEKPEKKEKVKTPLFEKSVKPP